MGSEEDPEVTNPSGNVKYDPTYTGPHNRHHIDLLAAWWDYNATTDRIIFHWKTVDNSLLADPPTDTAMGCLTGWHLMGAEAWQGNLTLSYGKERGETNFTGHAYIDRKNYTLGTGVRDTIITVGSRFEIAFAAPGYATVAVNRSQVFLYGERVQAPWVVCWESSCIQNPVNCPGRWSNGDFTSRGRGFSFVGLKPIDQPDVVFDPIEKLDPIYISSAPIQGPPEPTPSPSLFLVLLSGGLAGLFVRRR